MNVLSNELPKNYFSSSGMFLELFLGSWCSSFHNFNMNVLSNESHKNSFSSSGTFLELFLELWFSFLHNFNLNVLSIKKKYVP